MGGHHEPTHRSGWIIRLRPTLRDRIVDLRWHWSNVYDAVGNLTSKTDRKGQTIQYAYDALNRAGGPAFQTPTQFLLWVPRPSRSLRRAGIATADSMGFGRLMPRAGERRSLPNPG